MSNTTCPNCGAPISYNPGKENICRYCGCTISFNGNKVQADKSHDFINSYEFEVSPKGPFWLPCVEYSSDEVNKSKVKEAIPKAYGNENIDIAKARVDILERLYCPLVRFNGTVKAKWSCTQVIEHDDRESYVPRNGELTFSMDMLFDAVDSKTMPKAYPLYYRQIETMIVENEINQNRLSTKPIPSDFNVCRHISEGLTEFILKVLEREVWNRVQDKTGLFNSVRKNEDVTIDILTTEHTGEIYYVPVVNAAVTIRHSSCIVNIGYPEFFHYQFLRLSENTYVDLFGETEEYKTHKEKIKTEKQKAEDEKKKAENEKKKVEKEKYLQDLTEKYSGGGERKVVYITLVTILGLISLFLCLIDANHHFNLWGIIDLFCIGGIIWEFLLLISVPDLPGDKEIAQKVKKIAQRKRRISKILILLYVLCIIAGIIAQA